MNDVYNPKRRGGPTEQVLRALLSDDETMRGRAIWLFRRIGVRGQQILITEAFRCVDHVERCLRVLDAIEKVGLPLDEEGVLNLSFLTSHPDPSVADKVTQVLFTLRPGADRDPDLLAGKTQVEPEYVREALQSLNDYLARISSEPFTSPTGRGSFELDVLR